MITIETSRYILLFFYNTQSKNSTIREFCVLAIYLCVYIFLLFFYLLVFVLIMNLKTIGSCLSIRFDYSAVSNVDLFF